MFCCPENSFRAANQLARVLNGAALPKNQGMVPEEGVEPTRY